MCGVDGEEGVGLGGGFGGEVEVVVFGGVLEFGEWVGDRFVGERGDGEGEERSGGRGIVVEVGEDKVWVGWGMGGEDDMLGCVEECFDEFYVGEEVGVGVVRFVGGEVRGEEGECVGNNGEVVREKWGEGERVKGIGG